MAVYRSTYTGNYTGIGRMLRRPGMAKAVVVAATKMLPIAVTNSPTGNAATDPHPGLYRRSWRVEYGVKPIKFRGRPSERPYGRLINTTRYAVAVEHGVPNRVPRHAVLRKTLDEAVAAHGSP